MYMRKIDMTCLQEAKQGWGNAKKLERYKILYPDADLIGNGEGILVSWDLKDGKCEEILDQNLKY